MVVRQYKGTVYLTTGKSESWIKETDDIGEICEVQEPTKKDVRGDRVKIVGVEVLQMYAACLKCNGKVELIDVAEEGEEVEYAECTKCQTLQAFSNTKDAVFAQVLVQSMPSGDIRSVRMFDKIVLDIAQEKQVTKLSLLKARDFVIVEEVEGVIRQIKTCSN